MVMNGCQRFTRVKQLKPARLFDVDVVTALATQAQELGKKFDKFKLMNQASKMVCETHGGVHAILDCPIVGTT